MKVVSSSEKGFYQLGNGKGECIMYLNGSIEKYLYTLPVGSFRKVLIDPESGQQIGKAEQINGGTELTISNPENKALVIWISKII